jgi:hypothetical protein
MKELLLNSGCCGCGDPTYLTSGGCSPDEEKKCGWCIFFLFCDWYVMITLFYVLLIVTSHPRVNLHKILNKASQEQEDETEEEEVQATYYAAKNSKKKDLKKQDKEARRQVNLTFYYFRMAPFL